MSNAGAIQSIKAFTESLRALPRVLALKVAREAAGDLTEIAKADFAAQRDPYGNAWAKGAKGQDVDLVAQGDLRSYVRYVAAGTRLRVALSVPYAKYQIGKRPIAPRQGETLPEPYLRALIAVAQRVASEEMSK